MLHIHRAIIISDFVEINMYLFFMKLICSDHVIDTAWDLFVISFLIIHWQLQFSSDYSVLFWIWLEFGKISGFIKL